MACSQYKNDPFFKEATFCWLTTDQAGCIAKVRSQAKTDSCFAFVVSDVVYAMLYLNGKEPLHCSEQELLDHLHKHYPSSSYTGKVDEKGVANTYNNAFSYMKNYGICTAEKYPFVGKHQAFQGRAPMSGYKIFIHGFDIIPKGRHDLVVQQLEKHPVTGCVILGSNFKSWKPNMCVYKGLTPKEQREQDDAIRNKKDPIYGYHGITLIGYGTEDGNDYYLCKNSYGEGWGHRGHIKVLREIVKQFYYPIKPTLIGNTLKSKKN